MRAEMRVEMGMLRCMPSMATCGARADLRALHPRPDYACPLNPTRRQGLRAALRGICSEVGELAAALVPPVPLSTDAEAILALYDAQHGLRPSMLQVCACLHSCSWPLPLLSHTVPLTNQSSRHLRVDV